MLRAIAVWLIPLAVLAQSPYFQSSPSAPPQDPFNAAHYAYWAAHNDGRFEEAARYREEARRALAKVASDAPPLATWAGNLAGIYSNVGMAIEARSILEEALERVAAVEGRAILLNRLADLWEEDKNLLKSLSYREKAVAALESGQGAAPPSAPMAATQVSIARISSMPDMRSGRFQYVGENTYQRLADLYRKLGRPDGSAATLAKMLATARNDDARLAGQAEIAAREGNIDQAASIYKRLAEQAAAKSQNDPWQVSAPLQSLAQLYQRDGRYADAAAALRQAVAVFESSAKPEARNQAMGMQQQLANVLKQAGDVEGAERSYRQMLEQAPPEMQFQAVTSYANFLGETERAPQGLQLMQDYLTRGAAPPHEATMALFTLSQLARRAGDAKLADEYQKSAMAKQATRPEEKDRNFINPYFQKAQSAANAGRVDEGFALAMEAMSAAWHAVDRNSIVGFVSSIATALANRTSRRDPEAYEKASEKAAQLFDRLFTVVESWNDQTRQPLLDAREQYVRFLMHPDRRDKAEDAIARYREAVIAARGESSGWLEKVLQLKLQLADQSNQPERRAALARDLVQLEASLSGKTSDAYMRAVQMLANIYQNGGDPASALPLFLQAVAIADLVLEKGDSQRGYTRTQAADTLARLGRFDEAEKLIDEAVAIKLRPPQPDLFRSQAEQIQRMKLTAERPK